VTQDHVKISPFAPLRIAALALTPEQKAAFQRIGEQEKALRGGFAAVKTEDQLRARAKHARRQEAIWRGAAEDFETELAARIAARRGAAPPPAGSSVAEPSPPPKPEQPASDEEEQEGPQTELTRLFFQEVFAGRRPKNWSYRRLHARMKEWVAEKNRGDQGSRVVASETTVRTVRKKLWSVEQRKDLRAQP
jgi:hypothetical protein